MVPVDLIVVVQCPVCREPVCYPEHRDCQHCRWPVLLYTARPAATHRQELDTRFASHRQAMDLHRKYTADLADIRLQMEQRTDDNTRQEQQLAQLKEKLAGLTRQKKNLEDHSIHKENLGVLHNKLKDLKNRIKLQQQKLSATENRVPPPLTLRCSYDPFSNEIKAQVTALWRDEPVRIISSLGLAVASQPFTHFAQADLIIPVKDQLAEIKVIEIDQELTFPLAQKPLAAAKYFQVIHLYHHSISKFTIDDAN